MSRILTLLHTLTPLLTMITDTNSPVGRWVWAIKSPWPNVPGCIRDIV